MRHLPPRSSNTGVQAAQRRLEEIVAERVALALFQHAASVQEGSKSSGKASLTLLKASRPEHRPRRSTYDRYLVRERDVEPA